MTHTTRYDDGAPADPEETGREYDILGDDGSVVGAAQVSAATAALTISVWGGAPTAASVEAAMTALEAPGRAAGGET